MLLVPTVRIAQFDPQIEPKNKVGKIKAQAKASTHRDLAVKGIEDLNASIVAQELLFLQSKFTTRTRGVGAYGPDIAGVEEKSAV